MAISLNVHGLEPIDPFVLNAASPSENDRFCNVALILSLKIFFLYSNELHCRAPYFYTVLGFRLMLMVFPAGYIPFRLGFSFLLATPKGGNTDQRKAK